MGAKLPAGTHTRTPTSPAGPSRLETADANGTTNAGVYFAWNAGTGRYQARIPPPPATPPGEWAYLEFDTAEHYTLSQTTNLGQVVPVEVGHNAYNG